MTEYIDLYDMNRIKTGKTKQRGEVLAHDEYFLVVHVCIFNSKGEMLIQKRQPFKKGWSGLWDFTAAGSSISGETSAMAAGRELYEEIGLKWDFQNIRPHFTLNFENGFDDFYLIQAEIDLRTLSLQYEEVEAVKWASQAEIEAMIDTERFIPYYKNIMKLLFDMRHYYGSHSK